MRAFQGAGIESGVEVRPRLTRLQMSRGIRRIFADGGIEHHGEIRHGTRQRASYILGSGERDNSGDAGEAFSGPESDEVV